MEPYLDESDRHIKYHKNAKLSSQGHVVQKLGKCRSRTRDKSHVVLRNSQLFHNSQRYQLQLPMWTPCSLTFLNLHVRVPKFFSILPSLHKYFFISLISAENFKDLASSLAFKYIFFYYPCSQKESKCVLN